MIDAHVMNQPLYSITEAARIIEMPRGTFRDWARGQQARGADGHIQTAEPVITTSGFGRGPVVPFRGLAEGFVLNAFRAAGVSMQRIRPAVKRLEDEFGLVGALASRQLFTDGADVLWQFGKEVDDPTLQGGLVIVRNSQMIFTEVVRDYLRCITYGESGGVEAIRLPGFEPEVVVTPRINFGQPTLKSRGVRVSDILDRLAAGETARQVAADFLIPVADVVALAA